MTTPTVTERGRLTVLRAAWLFYGSGSALIPDPLVVIDGGTIVAVGSGAAAPHNVVRHAPDQLRQIGIGQAEALRMITSVAAEVIGLGHRKGRIAPGFDADILAVDGDPIADPDALHRIRAVWARGSAGPTAGTTRPGA